MSWFNKFFTRKIILPSNENVHTVEIDPDKNYIIFIKEGYVNINDIGRLKNVDPKKVNVVRMR